MNKWGSFGNALDALASWFERQKRVLPWRDEPSLYRVWISEIMLQQTQVASVIPYFERFTARFPDVRSLAHASVDDVMLQWAGLGYYSRARNLHRAARKIAEEGFPETRDGWLDVPGVGPYTAGAILSIALDRSEAILDGNVERVMSRVRAVKRERGDAAYKARLWRLSRLFVERAYGREIRPSVLNQALMELGATVCSPKKPRCLICPLASICRAHRRSEEESYPPRKKAKEWLDVREQVHSVFSAEGRMLLRKREAGEWRAGLWDFLSERPKGLRLEKIGSIESRLIVTRHRITRTTHVWKAKDASLLKAAEPRAEESESWISVSSPEVAVGSALRKTLKQIRETYPEALPEY